METTGLLWQDVMNGEAVGNTTAASANENGTASTSSNMDETKEMFLKLLVAEMQYQDPLEPTDNAEYVKELSQFTQVETLNSVNDQVESLAANTMVGKYVEITDSETNEKTEGKVDYVANDNGVLYVSVGGVLYKASDVTSVAESNYFENTTLAANVEEMINNLPNVERLTLSDSNSVSNVATALSSLSTEAYGMVSEDAKTRLSEIVAKMEELIEAQKKIDEEQTSSGSTNSSTEDTTETDSTESTTDTDSTESTTASTETSTDSTEADEETDEVSGSANVTEEESDSEDSEDEEIAVTVVD